VFNGGLRLKRQCKHSFTHVKLEKWKNGKMQVVTPELWHSGVLFLVGKLKLFPPNFDSKSDF